MKNTEIINMTALSIVRPKFANEHLQKATDRILSIYVNAAKYADEKNQEIAKILGEVLVKKSYTDDGFKSVADYAKTIFGINYQNAYALANAGKVYNDPKAPIELKKFSPSKLAAIAAVDETVVLKSIESGEITSNTTQKELKEYATSHSTKEDKPRKKKEKNYVAKLHMLIAEEFQEDFLFLDNEDTIENHILRLKSTITTPNINSELIHHKISVKDQILYAIYNDEFSVVISFYEKKE